MAKITAQTPLREILEIAKPCSCDSCKNGCRYGSGYLIEEDIEKIAKFLKISKEELKQKYLEESEKFNTKRLKPKLIKEKKPYGKCIFFDEEKLCTIHEAKPLHCRVAMCGEIGEQLSDWFTINYFVNKNDPESIRQWAAHLKLNKTIEGGDIKDIVKDSKLLKKMLSYELLK